MITNIIKYYGLWGGDNLCMENAKYAARIYFACIQIQWWIPKQTFLTPSTSHTGGIKAVLEE